MASTFIIDDFHLHLSGPRWNVTRSFSGDPDAYNATRSSWGMVPPRPSLSPSSESSAEVMFIGSSVSVIGWYTDDLELEYELDREERQVVSLDTSQARRHGATLLTIPNLPDEGNRRTLRLYPSKGQLSIDYISYTNPSFQQNGTEFVHQVDDGASADVITFEGDWEDVSADRIPNGGPVPLGGGWKSTSTVGARFDATFTGRTVSVYGFRPRALGNITVEFTIDDGVHAQNISYTSSRRDPSSGGSTSSSGWDAGLIFSTTQRIDPTVPHTLRAQVVSVSGGQTLNVDYITYTRPFLPPATDPGSTFHPTLPSDSDASDDRPPDIQSANRRTTTISSIVGSLAGLALFLGLFYWLYRRERRRHGSRTLIPLRVFRRRRRSEEERRTDWEGPIADPPPPWSPSTGEGGGVQAQQPHANGGPSPPPYIERTI